MVVNTTTSSPALVTSYLDSVHKSIVHDYLNPLMLNPVMLVIALLVVLLWHAKHCIPSFLKDITHNPILRSLGQGVVVLHIYHTNNLDAYVKGRQFTISCLFIFCDTVLLFGLSVLCNVYVSRKPPREKSKEASLNKKRIANYYMDISVPLRHMLIYFWVQLALMSYFYYWLNNDPRTHDRVNISILKWLVAVGITHLAGEAEAGIPFDFKYWSLLMHQDIPLGEFDRVFGCNSMPFKMHWAIRALCDGMINAICRTTVLGIAPVVLSVEEPLDFIKDCLAIFFITKLDDMDDPKNFKDVLEKMMKDERGSPWMETWMRRLECTTSMVTISRTSSGSIDTWDDVEEEQIVPLTNYCHNHC